MIQKAKMSQTTSASSLQSIRSRLVGGALLSALVVSQVACGKDAAKYEPVPAVSGVSAELPPVPSIPEKPIKNGEDYTVWGAAFQGRNRKDLLFVLHQVLQYVLIDM